MESMLFHVMYFPQNERIMTIYLVAFCDPNPCLKVNHGTFFFCSASMETILPWVNYAVSYLMFSIDTNKDIHSCLPSLDFILVIDYLLYQMGALESIFLVVGPSESSKTSSL